MMRIGRKTVTGELAAVEGVDEQFDGVDQCLLGSAEAAGTATQSGQVVTQFSIVPSTEKVSLLSSMG